MFHYNAYYLINTILIFLVYCHLYLASNIAKKKSWTLIGQVTNLAAGMKKKWCRKLDMEENNDWQSSTIAIEC